MESDVGRDTNKSLWMLGRYGFTLRRSEKPENKVQFFEHPHNAPLMEW